MFKELTLTIGGSPRAPRENAAIRKTATLRHTNTHIHTQEVPSCTGFQEVGMEGVAAGGGQRGVQEGYSTVDLTQMKA